MCATDCVSWGGAGGVVRVRRAVWARNAMWRLQGGDVGGSAAQVQHRGAALVTGYEGQGACGLCEVVGGSLGRGALLSGINWS